MELKGVENWLTLSTDLCSVVCYVCRRSAWFTCKTFVLATVPFVWQFPLCISHSSTFHAFGKVLQQIFQWSIWKKYFLCCSKHPMTSCSDFTSADWEGCQLYNMCNHSWFFPLHMPWNIHHITLLEVECIEFFVFWAIIFQKPQEPIKLTSDDTQLSSNWSMDWTWDIQIHVNSQ